MKGVGMNSLKLLWQMGGMILFVLLLAGCGASAAAPASETPVAAPTLELPIPTPAASTSAPTLSAATPTAILFELTSSAFEEGQPIPVRYTCHGENLSPSLTWNQPPPGTKSYVLIMEDPDAVGVAGFVWDHWLLFNVPADVLTLSEGIPGETELPDGSRQGQNSSNRTGYAGPCPPSGQTHGYVFTLYAVDTTLELETRPGKVDILRAIDGHILAQAQLVGLYTTP
jgi:Raf kinase inhibitor-like YbhB/YbcL family protein